MPSPDPWGKNAYGVTVRPIDPSEWGLDAPYAKTYHGLTIVVDNKLVGRITSWNPSEMSRDVTPIYELNYLTYGRIVDQVPGKASGNTVSGTSAELWDYEIEKRIMGNASEPRYRDLTDQNRPTTVYEHWFRGTRPREVWGYLGCWLNSKGDEAYSAEGETKVLNSFSLMYVAKQQVGAGI